MSDTDQGVVLALGAVAEALQKMDARFEAEEIRKAEAENSAYAAAEHEAMVKSIADGVYAVLKDRLESEMGLEVDGAEPVKVHGSDKWPMATRPQSSDSEQPTKLMTETKDVQRPIQAMRKEHSDQAEFDAGKPYNDMPVTEPAGDADASGVSPDKWASPKKAMDSKDKTEEKDLEDTSKEKKMYAMKMDEKEEHEKYPMKEEEEKESPMKEMKAYIAKLEKQLANVQKSVDEQVKKGVSASLSKMGIREERSLAPRVSTLGGVESLTLSKSNDPEEAALDLIYGEGTGELMKLSNSKLNEMKVKVDVAQRRRAMTVPLEILREAM